MSDETAAQMHGSILKSDDDKRVLWGWASVVTENGVPVVDTQGDIIAVDDLVEAAQGFMVDARKGGFMHMQKNGEAIRIGEVVESMVMTKARQDALGIDLGREGWLIAMKIHNDDVWKAAKDGTLAAFSIGGRGVRVPVTEG
jgi:hypothetical protein